LDQNIFLVGLMGSGKTTVGRKLAQLLGRKFIDTDHELMQRTGVTIAHIFEVEGESGFRDRETRLLGELCECDNLVVSTGGGVVSRRENLDLMKQCGRVVYLDVCLSTLWNRLKDCQHRPLLQVDNPREKVEQLSAERAPLYAEVADLTIRITSDSALRTARRIERELAGVN